MNILICHLLLILKVACYMCSIPSFLSHNCILEIFPYQNRVFSFFICSYIVFYVLVYYELNYTLFNQSPIVGNNPNNAAVNTFVILIDIAKLSPKGVIPFCTWNQWIMGVPISSQLCQQNICQTSVVLLIWWLRNISL